MANQSSSNKSSTQGDRPWEIPSLNVHVTNSSRQPTAGSRIIPAEMFPSILFDWPEFFDSELNSTSTKADEILSCFIDALKERNSTAIKNLGKHFSH